MKNHKKTYLVMTLFLLMILLSACSRYERQVVPFRLPSSYANAREVAGAVVAAQAYETKEEANAAFGFAIREAGILPVQVIFDNKGDHTFEIVPAQTYLVDKTDNLWPVLDERLAYDRINKKTEWGEILPEGGKAGLLAGAAGGIIGAAIGIVTGSNVGEAAGKGAAIGAAAGLVGGGAKGLTDEEARNQIRDDLQRRSLENQAIPPRQIARGFIFFPGEAKSAKELRLQLRTKDTGTLYSLTFSL